MRGSCTLFVFFFTGVSCLSFSTPLSTISLTVRPCSAAFAFICLYSWSGISIVVLIKTPNHNYGRVIPHPATNLQLQFKVHEQDPNGRRWSGPVWQEPRPRGARVH